ncbi:MAG TPA: hypothetical protein VH879_01740 [Gemmatimonadales bacterium]|jgi:hypothetical protein
MAQFSRMLLPLLLAAQTGLAAQASPLPPLSFLGFEAGQPLTAVGRQVEALGGRGLRCKTAKRDRAVVECRASVLDSISRRSVDLWLSAMDSAAGVLTLSSPLSGVELDAWRSGLEHAFGVVDAAVQGPQWMLQWVRQGQMLRLTWRVDRGEKVASVSLVDGYVLDTWGRSREKTAAGRRATGS